VVLSRTKVPEPLAFSETETGGRNGKHTGRRAWPERQRSRQPWLTALKANGTLSVVQPERRGSSSGAVGVIAMVGGPAFTTVNLIEAARSRTPSHCSRHQPLSIP